MLFFQNFCNGFSLAWYSTLSTGWWRCLQVHVVYDTTALGEPPANSASSMCN